MRMPTSAKSLFKRLAAVLLVTAAFMLSAALSFNTVVKLDPAVNRIYRSVNAAEMLDDLAGNQVRAAGRYDYQYLSISGSLGSVGSGGRYIDLIPSGGARSDNASIRCNITEAPLKEKIAELMPGDRLRVSGYTRISKIPSEMYTVSVSGIEVTNETSSYDSEEYRFLNGPLVRKSDFAVRNLGSSGTSDSARVTCRIPTDFIRCEEKLENVEGYLYRLNNSEKNAEQLYIFYFDNEEYLQNISDSTRTTEIEKSIIRNILPNETIGITAFPKKRNVYETYYQYYDTAYGAYNAEFAFAEDGDNGIFCILYVYRNSAHINDILYMMRFTDITG